MPHIYILSTLISPSAEAVEVSGINPALLGKVAESPNHLELITVISLLQPPHHIFNLGKCNSPILEEKYV